mgnify:CR=1 FL=1
METSCQIIGREIGGMGQSNRRWEDWAKTGKLEVTEWNVPVRPPREGDGDWEDWAKAETLEVTEWHLVEFLNWRKAKSTWKVLFLSCSK